MDPLQRPMLLPDCPDIPVSSVAFGPKLGIDPLPVGILLGLPDKPAVVVVDVPWSRTDPGEISVLMATARQDLTCKPCLLRNPGPG